MEKKWAELTPEEKREERFKQWLTLPDVEFISPEAEKAYKERITRLSKAIRLQEPDRVPVMLPAGNFPIYYGGGTLQKAMYDYEELRRVWRKFLYDFDMDTFGGPGSIYPAKVLEAIDFKMYKWPGHGLAPGVTSYQFVEDEYMMADEYDALIRDPSDFAMRVFMPRVVGALAPLKNMVPFSSILGIGSPIGYVSPGRRPDVQAAFQAIVDAGKEMERWQKVVADCSREALAAGFPSIRGGSTLAPFDCIADILRGTSGVTKDMYRQPDKLIEAMERITELTIEQAVSSANAFGAIMVGFPLHKGDDTFMSPKQFEKFYWPTLKKVILALIDEGLMVSLVAEGRYEMRLETIKDVPKGWTWWHFDQTDMAKAKKALGGVACIAGNVPSSLLYTGTPQDVKEYCRKLIEICGEGGGYILAGGSGVEKLNPDNLHAFMEAAKEYGVYK